MFGRDDDPIKKKQEMILARMSYAIKDPRSGL